MLTVFNPKRIEAMPDRVFCLEYMARRSARPTHLRLVHPVTAEPSRALLDPANRELLLQLGHDLAAVLIEIADIQDRDPEIEPDGDEAEEADSSEEDYH